MQMQKTTFSRWFVMWLTLGCLVSQTGFSQTNVTVLGNNAYGQKIVPAELTNAVAVSAGGEHIMALTPGGKVLVWGSNSSVETNVPTGLTNVVAIAAGSSHCLALKQDGTVAAWGTSVVTNVPANLTNVVAIAGGGGHGDFSLALKADGVVVALGEKEFWATQVPTRIGQ